MKANSNTCRFREMGPNVCFFKISIIWIFLKSEMTATLCTENWSLSCVEFYGSEFLINHSFLRKGYILLRVLEIL